MGKKNTTSWTVFLLVGLQHQNSPTVFLTVILFMFTIALMGNSLLLFLIRTDSGLNTPMYFFLSQLSVMDLCQILTIFPKMTVNFVTQSYEISLYGCAFQIFVTLTVGGAECFILTIMSYDRYVAICRPLQYPVLMQRKICYILSGCAWFGSSLQAMINALYVLPLPYCKSNVIIQYFCEYPALLRLSCSDNSTYENVTYFETFLVLLIPLSLVLASYIVILLQVLRSHSSERSNKALGTCLSHLFVVCLSFGGAILTYMIPTSSYTGQMAMINSVFSTILPATMNPFIYSLRNQDVLAALQKLFVKYTCINDSAGRQINR